MDFDQQIAQADLCPQRLFLTKFIGLLNKRIYADEMTDEELDRASFGSIQLDKDGNVLKYHDYESCLAG